MEKYYEWKYLNPSPSHPNRKDPLFIHPRLYQPQELLGRTTLMERKEREKDIKPVWRVYKEFIDGETIFELQSEQRTEEWKLARIGRMTSSNVASCIGLSSFNTDLSTVALQVDGYIEKQFTEEQKINMQNGVEREPLAKLHCESAYSCEIKERNLLVPSWAPFIGDSPDGETVISFWEGKNYVQDKRAAVEFKCPKRMYRMLEERLELREEKADVLEGDFSHIFPEHYVQCHMHMYCMNTQYCIYHVCDFNTEGGKVFTEVIPFNTNFWLWCIERIGIFYEKYLLPLTRNTGFPIPPSFSSLPMELE